MADSANVSNSEFFVIGQLSVGAKHLEDKLSVIPKNSSPNASPVQLSVVSRGEAFGR
jgi:ATP-dependent DNA helicase RecQ